MKILNIILLTLLILSFVYHKGRKDGVAVGEENMKRWYDIVRNSETNMIIDSSFCWHIGQDSIIFIDSVRSWSNPDNPTEWEIKDYK